MGNRRIAAGILTGEFKMPWHFLAEMPHHSRAEGARQSSNSDWWTHGESDPALVHAMDAFYRYTMGPANASLLYQILFNIKN